VTDMPMNDEIITVTDAANFEEFEIRIDADGDLAISGQDSMGCNIYIRRADIQRVVNFLALKGFKPEI
jgi:hypothetical protein